MKKILLHSKILGISASIIYSIGFLIVHTNITHAQGYTLPDPLGSDPKVPLTPQTLIGRVVRYLFGVAGSLALLNFVISGLRMMFAGGAADKIAAAKKSMQYTVIGLVAMFTSYAVIKFVILLLQNR